MDAKYINTMQVLDKKKISSLVNNKINRQFKKESKPLEKMYADNVTLDFTINLLHKILKRFDSVYGVDPKNYRTTVVTHVRGIISQLEQLKWEISLKKDLKPAIAQDEEKKMLEEKHQRLLVE